MPPGVIGEHGPAVPRRGRRPDQTDPLAARRAAARPAGRPRRHRSGRSGDQVDQGVVGEAREREVQVDRGRLHRVLALGGRPCRPVQLVGAEAQPARLLLVPASPPSRPGRARPPRAAPAPRPAARPAAGSRCASSGAPGARPPVLVGRSRSVTHSSAGAGGAPSARTCWRALSSSSTPWSSNSPSGRPSSGACGPCAGRRAALPLTTAGRRSASTRTTPQDASSSSASLSAIDRSRSICACTSLNAQYTPGGRPSAPRHGGRTGYGPGPGRRPWSAARTRAPGGPARPWRRHQPAPRPRSASAVRTAQPASPLRPTASAARPAEDALGLAVPVGDDAVGVERAQRGVHAVEQRGEQIGVVAGPPGRSRARARPSLVGRMRGTRGFGALRSGHRAPPAGRGGRGCRDGARTEH